MCPCARGAQGVSALVLEGAYYGSRRPADQRGSKLRRVSELLLLGYATIAEAIHLLHWAQRQGHGPLGALRKWGGGGVRAGGQGVVLSRGRPLQVPTGLPRQPSCSPARLPEGLSGLSMGGVHASMAAGLFPGDVAVAPLLAPRSAAVAYCDGAMRVGQRGEGGRSRRRADQPPHTAVAAQQGGRRAPWRARGPPGVAPPSVVRGRVRSTPSWVPRPQTAMAWEPLLSERDEANNPVLQVAAARMARRGWGGAGVGGPARACCGGDSAAELAHPAHNANEPRPHMRAVALVLRLANMGYGCPSLARFQPAR